MSAPALPRVHVVLEQCSLETVKTKKGFEVLNCDDHIGVCKKNGKDPSDYRPDIVHQVLLALMDSPLNKAGHLHVLMLTKKNVLIEISPHTRIPRTFKRFCGLMVQLLHNLRVRAADSSDTLMRVVKTNVTQQLPIGVDIVGLEVDAELLDAYDLPKRLAGGGSGAGGEVAAEGGGGGASVKVGKKRARAEEGGGGGAGAAAAAAAPAAPAAVAGPAKDVAFVIGAMSHGNINPPYITRTFSLSRYPLSAACTVGKLMNAYERAWGVL